jgi:phosphonate transport system substrate-binding protein
MKENRFLSRNPFLTVRSFTIGFSLFLLGSMVSVEAQEPLNWSPTLLERSSEREKEFQIFNHWLSEQTQLPFSVLLEPDYEQMLTQFERNKVAMLWIGPQMLRTLLQRRPETKVLALTQDQDGRADYRCILFSRQEYQGSVAALMSTSDIALTQPLSTCGSLGAAMLAKQAGVSLSQVKGRFTGSHQNAITSVMLDETQAGIVAPQVFDRFSWLPLRALSSSPLLPGFAWVVNPALVSSEQQAQLVKAFDTAGKAENRQAWYVSYRYGFETDQQRIMQLVNTFMQQAEGL